MEKEQARNVLYDEVVGIIFTSLNIKHIEKSSVNEQTALVGDGLGLDSIDILELVVNFEKKYSIKLDDTEAYATHFKNIGSVVDFIGSKKGA